MSTNNSYVSKKATIHPSVKIGPFCYIGDNVKIDKDCELKLNSKPFKPSVDDLHKNGKNFPPNFLHASWMDYLYWDIELEP